MRAPRLSPVTRLNCEALEDRVTPAVAYTLAGIGAGTASLVGFDTASPANTQTTAIVGIVAGEMLVGIDFRPQNGLLYGLGVNATGTGTLYTVSTRTGQATVVGAAGGVASGDGLPNPATAGVGFAFDFNPSVDAIRVVATDGDNFTINPNTGTTAANQTSAGTTLQFTGAGYTNNAANTTPLGVGVNAPTTLYMVSSANNSLYRIPTPGDPAGSGVLVGALGVGAFNAVNGFDIPAGVDVATSGNAVASGSGFAILNVSGVSRLYRVDLVTGAATAVGTVGTGTAVNGLAVQDNSGGFTAVGITGATVGTANLVRFNTATPGATSTAVSVTTMNETLVGIDYRPATGQLYGLGVNATTGAGTLYIINPQSGAVTVVGTTGGVTPTATLPNPATAGVGFGFDFNPTVDLIRVTTTAGQSFAVSPTTGAVTSNAPTITGATTAADAASYTNSFGQATGVGGATSLYVLNAATDTLYLQNAATSATTAVAPITFNGAPLDFSAVNGFDIPARVRVSASNTVASGFGYATLTVNNVTSLYRIDLTTGVATSLGTTTTGTSGLALGDAPAGAASFTATTATVGEGGGVAVINLTRTGGTSGPLTVTITVTGGTATAGTDFTAGPYAVTFADGATTASLSIPITNDVLVEGAETIVLTISSVSGGAVLGATTTTTVTITDNDTVPPIAIAAGAGAGGGSVNLYDAAGNFIRSFTPYAGYTGGVRVAVGDINGDGADDVVTGAAVNGHVKVFDGITGTELRSFFAYTNFPGGVTVAVGDVNGDGRLDVITGASVNGHVKAFSGTNNAELRSFFAYQGYTGSVTVASGDIDGDGRDDIITGAAIAGHVKVFSGANNAELRSFFAYTGFPGGVFVGSGDIDGDGRDDVITGATANGAVKVFSGTNNAELRSFLAFNGFTGAATVAGGDVNGDGRDDVIVGTGSGGSQVKVFSGTNNAELRNFSAFAGGFVGGVFVG